MSYKDEIKKFVKNSHYKQALDKLENVCDELINQCKSDADIEQFKEIKNKDIVLIQARLGEIERKERIGTKGSKSITREKLQIGYSILNILALPLFPEEVKDETVTWKAKEYYNQAINLIKEEKYEAAEQILTLAIDESPNFADAYVNRGFTRLSLGEKKYGQAEADFLEGLKKNPTNPCIVYRSIVITYLRLKRKEEAVKWWQVMENECKPGFGDANLMFSEINKLK